MLPQAMPSGCTTGTTTGTTATTSTPGATSDTWGRLLLGLRGRLRLAQAASKVGSRSESGSGASAGCHTSPTLIVPITVTRFFAVRVRRATRTHWQHISATQMPHIIAAAMRHTTATPMPFW